jgi:hypothetical protein
MDDYFIVTKTHAELPIITTRLKNRHLTMVESVISMWLLLGYNSRFTESPDNK